MRRRRAEKREVLSDPKLTNPMVTRFINIVMMEGKKSIARKIVYGALDILKQKTSDDSAVKAFSKALENARPHLELKPRRVGGATYQIPIEVSTLRGSSIAMRWIRDFARVKKGKSMMLKLADELAAAYKGEGSAIKKRDETHKMAEANKAFSHLRW